jgi:hypothetical protein
MARIHFTLDSGHGPALLAVLALAAGLWCSGCSEGASARDCSDGQDNDGDGLTDCDDPDCSPYCGDDDDDDDDSDCVGEDCDGDGYTEADGDCDDQDGSVHPSAIESCDGVDEDCDGTIDEDFDLDGDGYPDADNGACSGAYAPEQLDCDDENASVYPGAHEDCTDGVDNDCDGVVDEDEDVDGDGHTSCDGDCDDSDPTVHPGAPETCNDIDDNCDGVVDDGLPTQLYYPDADEDGFGDPDGSPASDCEAPEGYADNMEDCDDSDASVNPEADEVACDGVDNDCDPTTVDDPDDDADGYTACDDCDDGDPAVNPAAAEVICDGTDNDCDPATADDPDADGDGYTVCEDCDDSNPSMNPGQAETICDGLDNDCDPATDDDPDGDNDGHGTCTDCDDNEPDANPGLAEDCADGIDNDCDGDVDDNDVDCVVFLAEVQVNVFTPSCTSCHPSAGALALNNGVTHGQTVNVPSGELPSMDRVEPFDTANSYLWRKVDGTHLAVGGSGAQMPLVGSLTADEVQQITDWIDDGANP